MRKNQLMVYNGETGGTQKTAINDSWDFVEMMKDMPSGEASELYARVAAVFTACNKSAWALANMPFALVQKNGEDYDTSMDWQNKVGFWPNPKDQLKRIRLSLIRTNCAYLRMGKNVAKVPKQLHFCVPSSIVPVTDNNTGQLTGLERYANGRKIETYAPDDPSLIRFWYLDDQTELLPNDNTEFKAMMNAAGILYYADFFTQNFYKRGGIKPTLIAMKGIVSKDTKEEQEKSWTNFIKGIGQKAFASVARIFNAEAMDIKPFGDGLGDLKETPVYEQSLKNIALALDMPFSLLISNAANYATAEVERSQWFESVAARCEFVSECLNDQLFAPMGLRLQFRPEETDPNQEDEVQRVAAALQFGDTFTKYPTYDLWLNVMQGLFGYEIPDDVQKAAEQFYKDKEERSAKLQEQMNNKPPEPKPGEKPQEQQPPQQQQQVLPEQPKAWQPSIAEMEELTTYQGVSITKLNKGNCLEFEYTPHHGGLPENVMAYIKDRLPACANGGEVKALFASVKNEATVGYKSEIVLLAEAMNHLAEAQNKA